MPARVFYDSDGVPIEYGNRWQDGLGPENTYSVTAHPERFAPLHDVAEALIEYLTASYAVSLSEDIAFAADLLHGAIDVLRAVRVEPLNRNEAPLTFVFTAFPGIIVHAGLLHDFLFPDCGCDACDESLDSLLDELESIVLAVVEGRFSESVEPNATLRVRYRITEPGSPYGRQGATNLGSGPPNTQPAGDWASGGWASYPGAPQIAAQPPPRNFPPPEDTATRLRREDARLREAVARLAELPGNWQAWSTR